MPPSSAPQTCSCIPVAVLDDCSIKYRVRTQLGNEYPSASTSSSSTSSRSAQIRTVHWSSYSVGCAVSETGDGIVGGTVAAERGIGEGVKKGIQKCLCRGVRAGMLH